jgi:hypothetical protein
MGDHIVLRAILLVCIVSVFTSCDLLEPEPSPIVYLDVELVAGSTDLSSALAIRYSVLNRSRKEISSISVGFFLWDENGDQFPRYGDNFVRARTNVTIPPDESRTVTCSLDELVHVRPKGVVHATEFHAHRIRFHDGSTWEDQYRSFVYPYEISTDGADG